jgi:hypothetical protein
MRAVLKHSPAVAATPADEVITAASVAAACAALDRMTPAEMDAIRASNAARAQREETRRQDFALHLQIKANPQHWL